jgi:hypothetical protein
MKLQKSEPAQVPEWIKELVDTIAPQIDAGTQFVCKTIDVNMGASPRDGELVVFINNSESVKNSTFASDGEWTDSQPLKFKDGYTKNRTVLNWNYVIVENVVKGEAGATRVVKTLYTRNKQLHLELRLAMGHSGY